MRMSLRKNRSYEADIGAMGWWARQSELEKPGVAWRERAE